MTWRQSPVTEFHVRTVLSHEPVKQISGISGCQAWPRTLLSCPSSVTGSCAVYLPSGVSSKIFAVLSSLTLMSRPWTSGEYSTPYTFVVCLSLMTSMD